MTEVKERAVTMIQTLSDDSVFFLMRIMENLSPHADDFTLAKRRKVSADLQQFKGRLKTDFNYKKELADWRDERYGSID